MTASPHAIAAFKLGMVLAVLATTTVGLRFLAKRRTRMELGPDDWCVFVGLVFMGGFMVTSGMLVFDAGLGKHESDLTPKENDLFGKVEFASELLYLFTMAFAKISILLLYRRLFTTRTFRIVTVVMGGIVAAWCISSVLVTSFQCDPIAAVWNFNLQATCLDPVVFSLAIAVTGVLTDLIVLVLPLQVVWKLHLPTRQKLTLSAIFLLGGFTCVASVMRIVTLQDLDDNDLPYTLLVSATWALTEAELAIICANLPSLRPILPSKARFLKFKSFIWSSLGKSTGSAQSETPVASQDRYEMKPLTLGSALDSCDRFGSLGDEEQGEGEMFERAGRGVEMGG